MDNTAAYLLNAVRSNHTSRRISILHPHVPPASRHFIFPSHGLTSLDIVLFWEISCENRRGFITLFENSLGVQHAILKDIVEEAESSRVKRSMYAETQRERAEILDAIRASEWNVETNPLALILESERAVEHDFASGYVGLSLITSNIQCNSCSLQTMFDASRLQNTELLLEIRHEIHDLAWQRKGFVSST
jgi:trafficking protein particle complex subunit 8